MPLYEYDCQDCRRTFEQLVAASASRDAVECPGCGSRKTRRRLSVFAAHDAKGQAAAFGSGGACGRCGDPAGPCSP